MVSQNQVRLASRPSLIATLYQVAIQHSHQNVCEFDFRYKQRKVTDVEPSESFQFGISGKRLTYRHDGRCSQVAVGSGTRIIQYGEN